DAEELVADPAALGRGRAGPVRPYVAAANARAHDADNRVGRVLQDWVWHVFDPDVTGTVDEGCANGVSSEMSVRIRAWVTATPGHSSNRRERGAGLQW